MKSVILSFVIFAVVFTALSFNITDIFASRAFYYISRGSVVLALLAGVVFVGFPGIKGGKSNTDTSSAVEPQKTEDKTHEE